uniref:Uncharacterized protein n=1 Tax=Klebsiella pneumoniae TaxID=573 RepID=A0A8B0SW96_KLEPN|nr:hypothetical protein [Klebsiella pneumoniae]
MMLTASVSRKRKDDSAYRSQCFIVVPVESQSSRAYSGKIRPGFWISSVALPGLYMGYSWSRSNN